MEAAVVFDVFGFGRKGVDFDAETGCASGERLYLRNFFEEAGADNFVGNLLGRSGVHLREVRAVAKPPGGGELA